MGEHYRRDFSYLCPPPKKGGPKVTAVPSFHSRNFVSFIGEAWQESILCQRSEKAFQSEIKSPCTCSKSHDPMDFVQPRGHVNRSRSIHEISRGVGGANAFVARKRISGKPDKPWWEMCGGFPFRERKFAIANCSLFELMDEKDRVP